jgi:4-diphosphocytidyl-2-C-methyl-D-erythritol kinase
MPTLLAPAKVNLTLEVLSRRDDGYHTLRSVMVPVGLYDRIDLEPASVPSFRSSVASVEQGNLIERALERAGVTLPLEVRLDKQIPVGGGLGGGSSDAAAVLRAAMSGAFGAPAELDWLAVARELGSDVPFFLSGTAALVEGTGERVTALGALPAWWTVVAQPRVAVATADAYRRLDAARPTPRATRPRAESRSLATVDALQRGDLAALLATLVNDFHDVILASFPEIARTAAALERSGASVALLSGSGSCIFTLFEDEEAARACAARVDPAAYAQIFVAPFHHDPAWR